MNPPGGKLPELPHPARIAFFGGSFDPPHRGHLAIATAAADRFHLDRILFAPVAHQPLKAGSSVSASYEDRLAMVELACQADPRFSPSTLDAPRQDGQPNYTIDTLTTLQRSLSPGDHLFCLIGADSFQDLPRWREADRLLTICEWIVASRPGIALPDPSRIATGRVHILDGVYEDVSATAIRNAIHSAVQPGGSGSGLLPPLVEQYIRQHHLYR